MIRPCIELTCLTTGEKLPIASTRRRENRTSPPSDSCKIWGILSVNYHLSTKVSISKRKSRAFINSSAKKSTNSEVCRVHHGDVFYRGR